MDFAFTPRVEELRTRVRAFMEERVLPANAQWHRDVEAGIYPPPVVEELKAQARTEGLWNLFLPGLRDEEPGTRLTNLEYAPLAEIMGRIPWASELFNCNAPDTGNMETLHMFATEKQKQQWLEPLFNGEIRSAFLMTEPDVASSDARNIRSSIVQDGDHWVLNGRKWWSTNAAGPRCKIAIFMGVSNPNAEPYRQQSMVLVPFGTPGFEVVRELPVFGHYDGAGGHPEVRLTDVRVPLENMLGNEGDGFMIAQARLGPGRIHHCMRLIGMAERAFDLMVKRALERETFGKPVADQGLFQHWIAQARIKIEQTRLLTLKAAHLMDTVGNKGARMEIAAIKVAAPQMAEWVLDKAIQTHGAGGFSNDWPLAMMWAHARTLRMADGPDEVHEMSLARREIKRYLPQT